MKFTITRNAKNPIETQQNEEDFILDEMSRSRVDQLFRKTELKSLLKASEDIRMLCIAREDARVAKTKRIIDFDVPEDTGATSTAAVGSLDITHYNTQCPRDKYHRICYHTHTHSLKAQSPQDRLTAAKLKAKGLADVMCAIGVDGVECHFSHADPPSIATSEWDDAFRQDLTSIVTSSSVNMLQPNQDVISKASAEVDQILCLQTIEDGNTIFKCKGRNWGVGADDFELGKFNAMSLVGGSFDMSGVDTKTGAYGGFIGSPKRASPWSCVSIPYLVKRMGGDHLPGRKLLCV